MPLTDSSILMKLSTRSATRGYRVAQTNKNLSLGGWMSTTSWTRNTLHNLFSSATDAEDNASTVHYACFFIFNNHSFHTYYDVAVWVASQVAGGATVAIGVDPTAANLWDAITQQAVETTARTTAPSGVTFSTPVTEETALTIGTLGPKRCRAVWVRRTLANTGEQSADGAVIRFKGDIAA